MSVAIVPFGINFFSTVRQDQKEAAVYFDEALRLSVLAEELGFSHVRTVEHLFRPYGGMTPSPIVFLTAVAARTNRVRLVTGAVLPLQPSDQDRRRDRDAGCDLARPARCGVRPGISAGGVRRLRAPDGGESCALRGRHRRRAAALDRDRRRVRGRLLQVRTGHLEPAAGAEAASADPHRRGRHAGELRVGRAAGPPPHGRPVSLRLRGPPSQPQALPRDVRGCDPRAADPARPDVVPHARRRDRSAGHSRGDAADGAVRRPL